MILAHPEVAYRDCSHCRAWQYEENGQVKIHHGKPLKRIGKVACELPKGCPKGTHENPIELTEENWEAYIHYQECRAVGVFPDDPIVRRNARIIRRIEDSREAAKREGLFEAIRILASR